MVGLGLEFDGTKQPVLMAWTDAEWGSDKSDSKSVECYIWFRMLMSALCTQRHQSLIGSYVD